MYLCDLPCSGDPWKHCNARPGLHLPESWWVLSEGTGLQFRQNTHLDSVQHVNLWTEKGLGIHSINPKLVVEYSYVCTSYTHNKLLKSSALDPVSFIQNSDSMLISLIPRGFLIPTHRDFPFTGIEFSGRNVPLLLSHSLPAYLAPLPQKCLDSQEAKQHLLHIH